MRDAWRLRPVQDGDADFLRRLFAETRAAEIALTGWDDAAAAAFLHMQFDAQQRHYRASYPGARFDIVELAGEPAGRLSVARTADALQVIDIALLARYRNQGVGTRLLQSVLAEARAADCRVALQVEQHNPARALYRRLGFFETGLDGIYLPMEWSALPSHPLAPG